MSQTSKTQWSSIIYRGIESETLDYKAAQNWRDLNRREKGKFVRHCLALANTKGGYIVVGVGEDSAGKPSLFTGLTDEQAKSFDPSDVGNFINHRVDPPIDFEVVRPTVDEKTYAIFVVNRFRELPHVASGQVEDELQVGCFYIRTADATSRVAYRAAEIHDIVQRALRNQREILGRMIRGLLYEKGLKPEPVDTSLFTEELRRAETFLMKNAKGAFSDAGFEVISTPPKYDRRAFGLAEIRDSIRAAHKHFSSPLMPVEDDQRTYFTNVSLRSLSLHSVQHPLHPAIYFQAFRSGLFHFQSALALVENREIAIGDMVPLVVGSLYFIANYYDALGWEDRLITITFRIKGVDGAHVSIVDRRGKSQRYVCRIPEIRFEMNRSAADLIAGIVEHATRVIHNIFIRFNVPESRQTWFHKEISEYLGDLGISFLGNSKK